MISWTSRLQPSPNLGVARQPAVTRRAKVATRALATTALLCLALGVVLHQDLGGGSRPVPSVVHSHVYSQEGLLSLPLTAQGPISAAMGRDQAAYRIEGLVAHNPAQRLSARFEPSGVAIAAGSTRFAISLKAFGREGALQVLSPVSPVASADR